MAALADVCTITMGQAPPGDSYNTDGRGLPLIAGAGDFDGAKPSVKKFTTAPSKLSATGDIVLGIRASIGERVWSDSEYCLGRGVAGLRAGDRLSSNYLWHWLGHSARALAAKGKGATFLQVNRSDIGGMQIPLPPLPEQRRIAAILDRADELRAKRRRTLALHDDLTQSIFLDMFGDPARSDPSTRVRLGDLALKFSDGPFGSNLKSSHYRPTGIRVIRLQNIGVGRFSDDDAAFISKEHFADLRKHECVPGDVLIGTLGDPNLRACVQPDSLGIAINKADCVQMRVDPTAAASTYVCAMLNMPGTLALANSMVQGQTRARISMGRLRELPVPVPAVGAQHEFVRRFQAARAVRRIAEADQLDELFASLQSRAFAGQL